MQILSHRGYWKENCEKNKAVAFHRSFQLGFGTETDLRDCAGHIVISHDIPKGHEMTLVEMLDIYRQYDTKLPLALNIKSDGLQEQVKLILNELNIENYFLFDMSVPDHKVSLKHGLTCFTRQSEYEKCPLYEDSKGVWLDCFESDWINEEIITQHLSKEKDVCIVSPDLHGRDPMPSWEQYKKSKLLTRSSRVMLCTDYPEKAREYFL